jgi:hypothetical protein
MCNSRAEPPSIASVDPDEAAGTAAILAARLKPEIGLTCF